MEKQFFGNDIEVTREEVGREGDYDMTITLSYPPFVIDSVTVEVTTDGIRISGELGLFPDTLTGTDKTEDTVEIEFSENEFAFGCMDVRLKQQSLQIKANVVEGIVGREFESSGSSTYGMLLHNKSVTLESGITSEDMDLQDSPLDNYIESKQETISDEVLVTGVFPQTGTDSLGIIGLSRTLLSILSEVATATAKLRLGLKSNYGIEVEKSPVHQTRTFQSSAVTSYKYRSESKDLTPTQLRIVSYDSDNNGIYLNQTLAQENIQKTIHSVGSLEKQLDELSREYDQYTPEEAAKKIFNSSGESVTEESEPAFLKRNSSTYSYNPPYTVDSSVISVEENDDRTLFGFKLEKGVQSESGIMYMDTKNSYQTEE